MIYLEDKLLFGKILGEIYRIQNRNGYCGVGESVIYGLLNGFESVIDEEIERIGHITKSEIRTVIDILDEYHKDEEKFKELTGFYDIEDKLDENGITRWKAIQILTYLKANRQFVDVIAKFNSSNSPVECKRFEIDEWDK